MPDALLLETGTTDRYLLEDGSGVVLVDAPLQGATLIPATVTATGDAVESPAGTWSILGANSFSNYVQRGPDAPAGKAWLFRLNSMPTTAGFQVNAEWRDPALSSNQVGWQIVANTSIRARQQNTQLKAATVASASTMWFAVEQAGPNVAFYTSVDGVTWTEFHRTTANFNLTGSNFRIGTNQTAGGTERAVVSSINTLLDTIPPGQPLNPQTTVVGDDVTVDWTEPADNSGQTVPSYRVYRRPTDAGTGDLTGYSLVGSPTTNTYADPNLANGSYWYRIVAVDAAGNASAASDPVLAFVNVTVDTTAPTVPTGLYTVVTNDSVYVDWFHSTDDVARSHYEVHRSTTSGFTPVVGTLVGSPTSGEFTDVGVANGTYYYRVIAVDTSGNKSDPTDEASAVVNYTPPAPGSEIWRPPDWTASTPASAFLWTDEDTTNDEYGSMVTATVGPSTRALKSVIPTLASKGYRGMKALAPTDADFPRDELAVKWTLRWTTLGDINVKSDTKFGYGPAIAPSGTTDDAAISSGGNKNPGSAYVRLTYVRAGYLGTNNPPTPSICSYIYAEQIGSKTFQSYGIRHVLRSPANATIGLTAGTDYEVIVYVRKNTPGNVDGRVVIYINGTKYLDEPAKWVTDANSSQWAYLLTQTFCNEAPTQSAELLQSEPVIYPDLASALDTGSSGSTFQASGTVAATSATTGAVSLVARPTGTVAATSSTTGAVSLVARPSGATPATSATTGTVRAVLAASGTVAATSVTTGAVGSVQPAAGTVAAVSGTSGAATITSGATTWQAAGTVAVTSGTTGSVRLVAASAGVIAATTTTTGAATRLAPAAGTIAAVSAATGNPTRLGAVSGTVTVVSSTSGTLRLVTTATGTTGVTSTTTGTVTLTALAAGTVAAVSDTMGAPHLALPPGVPPLPPVLTVTGATPARTLTPAHGGLAVVGTSTARTLTPEAP